MKQPLSKQYKDYAAAAATTLTIRHNRFATLTLAKLVASLALYLPQRRITRLISQDKPDSFPSKGKPFDGRALYKKLRFPSSASLCSAPSPIWGKAFIVPWIS